ncbi:MAG: hypothetical protein ABIP74_00165 [Candidatus Saccharimonas sp.]
MEANPELAETIGEQLFNALVKVAATPRHAVSFTFRPDAIQYQTFDHVEEEIGAVLDVHSDYVSYSNITIDAARRRVSVDIEVFEPMFSNQLYGRLALINHADTRHWLLTTRYAEPIDAGRIYTCSLMVKQNSSDAFLVWDGGEELLYHFENMDSPRYIFFRYLHQNTDMMHTLESLKAQSIVPASTTKLHEYFSKTFMTGLLKKKFAIITEKNRIGIKSAVQLTGADLIAIIRHNLISVEGSQQRHLIRKVEKKLSSS